MVVRREGETDRSASGRAEDEAVALDVDVLLRYDE